MRGAPSAARTLPGFFLPARDVHDPNRARLGFMREKNDHKNSAPDNEQQRDEPALSLVNSPEPAPINIVAFGKRLAEIIAKAVRASLNRHKSRR
jgi:hypothetical protein